MGKKRSWINLVKRLFIPEGKSKEEKKSKRWTWVFGRLKFKQYPALAVPQRSLSEATEEQRKHAVAVAIATAAAAEAAITAAHAAAEVVRLTSVPYRFETLNQNLAAIKIQTSFRAHLAKKALRALKGVVRLQAVIRGQIVRRFITHLKSLQSTEKPHSQVHQIRVPRIDEGCTYGEEKLFPSPRKILGDEDTKIGCKSNKNWDFSLFSKEDREGSLLQKQEAITKRDRMKKYSFSHRERRNNVIFEESTSKEDGKRRSWFEEYQEMDARRRRETEKLKSVEILNSSISLPRRSFCRVNKRHSVTDDTSLPSSPVFPTYMASTESATAKVRSASTPRQWLGHQDFCAVHSSLCNKPKISSWSYSDGELAGINGKCATSQHKFVRTNGR